MRFEFVILRGVYCVLFAIYLFTSCDNSKNNLQSENKPSLPDTTNAFKIENRWVRQKPTFEIHSLNKTSNDTLSIVTCDEFVFSPFGLMKNKTDLATSTLNNFNFKCRKNKMEIGVVEFQILRFKSSKLILFFDDDPEASRQSYIFKGDISDREVKFTKNISVGMSIEQILNNFFENFPKELLDKYKCIVLESCVQDIKHFYTFKDNKLESVKFITDSYWKVDY